MDTSKKFQNPAYLLGEQYRDASNLNARIRLHVLFSTNPTGLQRWMFAHFNLPASCRILEVGCGPGTIWVENLERLPAGWQITLTDFSTGMVSKARQALEGHPQFEFEIMDAQHIPYEEASFDAVMAHFMLYHVPDLDRALAELKRVLKPGGSFFAATPGPGHLKEIYRIAAEFAPSWDAQHWSLPFSLANGQELLAPYFVEIKRHLYPDSLIITQAQPLADYILSSFRLADTPPGRDRAAALTAHIAQIIESGGPIRVQKNTGLFTAVKG